MTVRIIQVGLGQWGRSWAKSVLPRSPEVEVVSWVDPDPGARELTREMVGAPAGKFFASLDDAFHATDADAVLVSSGIRSHAPLALAALRSGKHVLLEKPFAPTVAEAAEVVAEARKRSLVLSVSQNYRFFPSMLAMAALVQAEKLGPVHRIRMDFRRFHPGRGTAALDNELLAPLSIHHFDLLRAILGREPLRVACHLWDPSGDPAALCSGSAVIEFEGGAVVTYSASRLSTGAETPWEGEWHVECERGEFSWARDGGSGVGPVTDGIEVRPVDGPARTVELPVPPLRERAGVLARFVAAVADGTEPASPGHDNIRSLALLSAARESAATGRMVPVLAPGGFGAVANKH